jgi:uncharacterized membrane protein HdeD (DUF308 family)
LRKRGIVLNEKLVSYIFFIVAIIDLVIGVFNFIDNRMGIGATYLIIGIVFIILGFRYRKRYNK